MLAGRCELVTFFFWGGGGVGVKLAIGVSQFQGPFLGDQKNLARQYFFSL